MKPKKPFMIISGDNFMRVLPSGKIKWVDWDGDKFATREDAEIVLNVARGLHDVPPDAKIIEIIDQVRARV